uniref:ILCR1 Ig-like domain-containing protein n=1 Tax=Magallana gigas TaxID=29159 RepID=K1QN42_MAGGI
MQSGITDCRAEFLQSQYPVLYSNSQNITIATPNVTIETRDIKDRYGLFTLVNVTIHPGNELEAEIQGFEARLTSIEGSRCVIVTSFGNGTFSEAERNSGFSFRLKLSKSVNFSVWSLPKSPASLPAESFILAGETIDYPPENSSLWYTKIWFVNNSRDRIVEVQFQPAPAAYGIRYYNIQLRQIKYSGFEGMTSRLTTHAKMEFAMSSSIYVKFRDVEPGMYRIKVEPYDDLKGDHDRCRCKRFGACKACNCTETPTFIIEDTRPVVTTSKEYTTGEISTSINTHDIATLTHKQTKQWNGLKMQLQNDDITWAMVSTGSEEKTPALHSDLPEVSDNNSQTGQNFEEAVGNKGENEDAGSSWKVPVSVFSVLTVALGAIVSVFAVVNYKRQGSGPGIVIIHDPKHNAHAQQLLTSINKDIPEVIVETKMFNDKCLWKKLASDSTFFVLWMTPKSFTQFERRLLKDRRIPSSVLSQIQKRFVVIESENEECRIQPRIQYWTKYVLNKELDIFLNFLRSNVLQESRDAWLPFKQTTADTTESHQALLRHYSRMDSGIHSDFENEADFTPCENDVEKASIAAVTIAECHMDAPITHQNKPTALSFPSHQLAKKTIAELEILPEEQRELSRVDTKDRFMPPEAFSCYDVEGSILSEAIMFLNERNAPPMAASLKFPEDSLSLTNDDFLMFRASVDRRSDTPVCYQNLIGYEEEIEEDPYEDQSPDVEYPPLPVGDADSVGGLSC